MKITDVKINGVENPLGYLFQTISCSWKINNPESVELIHTSIEIAADPDFAEICYQKDAKKLNRLGEKLEFLPLACTRYFIRIVEETVNGEKIYNDSHFFETGKIEEPWQADWITTQQSDTFHPCFYKEFSLSKEIKNARIYISGLGMFETFLNGKRVGKEVLTPYYSNYHDETQYLTFDITEQLKEQNRIEIYLGNGWYKGRYGLAGLRNNFGDAFKCIAEIRIECTDGTTKILGTDESWEYLGSDFEDTDIYDGEILNRLLWKDAENRPRQSVKSAISGKLTERYSIPVYEMEELQVKEIIYTPKGETVLDFGQNFAGYVAFQADFLSGTRIELDFGEILQDGNFYNDNYRSAKTRYVYVSNGRKECVRPHFTFFGFRYVRVTGWTGQLKENHFKGIAIYSDMKQTGVIKSGHSGLNQLFSNVLWGQKSNSIDFPTDCPQRDERLGWTGDAQVFAKTASLNMNTAAFFRKFLHDLRTEQLKADGILPGVIPVFDPDRVIFSSVWGDIATFLPTVLFEQFGDIHALAELYPMMRDWVDKITREDQKRGQRFLFDFGAQLGDWLSLNGRTSQSMMGGTDEYFIASCYYAASVGKTADAAAILGCPKDEQNYRQLYDNIYHAILKEYFTQTGRLSIDTQTAYIVSLNFGIYKEKEVVIRSLKERLYKDCYKLTGGFVGAPILCRVLAENGLEEEALHFLLQEDYPGWMHCIQLGATTVWERWNSVLDNGKMSGTMMNSLNHFAFGTVMEYVYAHVAGLRPLEPGYRKAAIAPIVNQKIGFLELTYDSVCGQYFIGWKIEKDGMISVAVTVPFDCEAILKLPYCDQGELKLEAGNYSYHYQPNKDVRSVFSELSLFKDIMKNEKAVEIIQKHFPMLWHMLESGSEDFLYETPGTLSRMEFLGFSKAGVEAMKAELYKIYE